MCWVVSAGLWVVLGRMEYEASRTYFGSVSSVDSSNLDDSSFLASVVLPISINAVHFSYTRNAPSMVYENSHPGSSFMISGLKTGSLLRSMCLWRLHSQAAAKHENMKHDPRPPKCHRTAAAARSPHA